MAIQYVFSLPGILKCVQEVFNFIVLVCLASSGLEKKGEILLACSAIALTVTAICFLLYILDMQDKLCYPLLKLEFFINVFFVLFYLPVSALVVDFGQAANNGNYLAGGAFGILAVFAYGVDVIHKSIYNS